MSHSENFPLEEFNLQSFTDNFMRALQQDFDLLAFTLSAHQHANDSSYQSYSLKPRIMPLAPCHQNFEQLQAHARDRLVRQVIADALYRVLAALDKMHLFLQLVQHKQNAMGVLPEIQKQIQVKHRQFVELRTSQKFHFLKLSFDVKSPFTDFVLALELVFDALTHHRGYVQDQHLNAGLSLVLLLNRVAAEPGAASRIVDEQLVFEKGQSIVLGTNHLQQVVITVSMFADHLFRSVAAYTQARVDGS
jgi:hypothetical protein